MAQLKELVDIYLGVTHTPEYVENGVPFLSVKDISGGKICFDDCKYISEATATNILMELNPTFFEIKEESGFVKKLLNKVNGN